MFYGIKAQFVEYVMFYSITAQFALCVIVYGITAQLDQCVMFYGITAQFVLCVIYPWLALSLSRSQCAMSTDQSQPAIHPSSVHPVSH